CPPIPQHSQSRSTAHMPTSQAPSLHPGTPFRKFSPRYAGASYHVPMAGSITTKLDVRGLTVELPTEAGWIRPVNDVSFSLAEGETLGIVGESGAGKTMLSLALMGLYPPGARRSGEAWLVTRDGGRMNLVAA